MRQLTLSLNGLSVGVLAKEPSGGLSFTYDEQWTNRSGARPISLSLPLTEKRYQGEKVYNYFENLLPDNARISERIQARFKVSSSHVFDLLEAVGNDCVGAVQLSRHSPKDVRGINCYPVSNKEIEKMLSGYKEAPLGMQKIDEDFRISIAGAQEKTALLWFNEQWNKPIGATPTSHIMKLPIGELAGTDIDLTDSCENEFVCLELARALGFKVANSQVMYFGRQKVLSVERFDRRYSSDGSWLMRLPQEDFCQAMGYSSAQKYQSDGGPGIKECLGLLQASVNQSDRDTFFKTQILFWLLAAIDGHGKNFSVFLLPHNRYTMTPLYDILSAYPILSKRKLQKQKIKMAMSLKGKNVHWHWYGIMPRHFISTAKVAGYSQQRAQQSFEQIMDEIGAAMAKVELLVPDRFPGYVAASIFAGIRQRLRKVKL